MYTDEERLKGLMKELGHAINESLAESDAIAEAIGEIRREGYDVYLVLEATIGLSKRDNDPPETPKEDFSQQDRDFLKALKIKTEDE